MSDIRRAFDHGKAFIAFVTGGDPSMDKTEEFVLDMVRAGADLIEIGIPFSDPVAEGPVIQEASHRALCAGANVKGLLGTVASIKKKTDVPIVFMTYLNPVFHYGYESFFRECREAGVDGIIIPDLPFEEKREVSVVSERYGVDVISMVAPTSKNRIARIAKDANGFVYIVSSMGVTGVRDEIDTDTYSMTEAIRSVTDTPTAVGFGISTPEQAENMGRMADGVIVGSAIVRIISEHGDDSGPYLFDYVKKMKEAVRRCS
ncbi:MAG: tryptophan synthase subunit alpha [Candidatus Methanomethylophilaceae archaeon]